jgi:hypothetical protein
MMQTIANIVMALILVTVIYGVYDIIKQINENEK